MLAVWGHVQALRSQMHSNATHIQVYHTESVIGILFTALVGHLVQQLVKEVDYTHKICSVVAGLDHSVALTSEGMAFAWGDNSEGQCGLGHRLMWARSPTLIPTIRNNGIRLKR